MVCAYDEGDETTSVFCSTLKIKIQENDIAMSIEIVRFWPVNVSSLWYNGGTKEQLSVNNLYFVKDLDALEEVEKFIRHEAEGLGLVTVVRKERKGGFFSLPEKVVETLSRWIICEVKAVEGGEAAYALWDEELGVYKLLYSDPSGYGYASVNVGSTVILKPVSFNGKSILISS
jgi:hypothetical protein